MRCPSCNEEAGLIVGDADFSSLSLVGLVANAEVTQSQFCDKCSGVLRKNLYRTVVDQPEADSHTGKGHEPDLHQDGVTPLNGEVEVEFRFVCSCGVETKHTKIAKPWLNPKG